MNDNSSRFGKLIEVVFSEEGAILGGEYMGKITKERKRNISHFLASKSTCMDSINLVVQWRIFKQKQK